VWSRIVDCFKESAAIAAAEAEATANK